MGKMSQLWLRGCFSMNFKISSQFVASCLWAFGHLINRLFQKLLIKVLFKPIKKMLQYNLLEMLKFGKKQYPTFMHIFMQLLNIICRGYRFNHLPFIQMNHFDLVKNKKLQLNEMTYLIVKCFKICHIFGWNMKCQLVFHFLCYYKDQRIH